MATGQPTAAATGRTLAGSGERQATLVALLGLLAVASWSVLWAWSASPYARYLAHDGWGDAGALATGLDRHVAIALGIGIAGIHHHLAFELGLQILADLRQGPVWDRDEDHVSEDGCLSRRAGACLGTERPRQALELVRMA